MAADLSPALGEMLRRLSQAVGWYEGADVSFADGHERWSLYRVATDTPGALPLLFEAVSLEPDGSLASGVVGEVLERVPGDERERWVRILPPAVREFSARRARELGVLESLRQGAVSAESVGELIGGWSDWLQSRATRVTADQDTLRVVSQKGRTKRIRQAAVEALRGSRREAATDWAK
ncbi:hypothetical protein ADL01_08395 [Streptomyces sp. NRRL WC-3618]|uniref:hypothetical protein n=1 Tax=Streptomyces sp. NRRL WC-3618 TaxID=1519490 RepID=UPI0006AFE638|nr:hypothetical protein [Streptomyces sp. NRRL WC-3618]KOV84907.1 hypothetical protein ADL01_08395 [Streptomyces sp. NRRL WC-3618]